MAKPAAASEAEVEVKPKGPMVKIILAVVGLVILISGTMVGTLFISGVFSQPKPSADHAADEEAGHGKPAAEAGHGKPEADVKAAK